METGKGRYLHHAGDRLPLGVEGLDALPQVFLLLVEAVLGHVGRTVEEATSGERHVRLLDQFIGQSDHADACEHHEEQPPHHAEQCQHPHEPCHFDL